VVVQTQREVVPSLAVVVVGPRQILLVTRRLMEARPFMVRVVVLAEEPVVPVPGVSEVLGVIILRAAVALLVGLPMLEHLVIMDAEMAAAGQQVNKLVQAGMAELLEAGEEEAEAPLLLALAVPMAVTAVMAQSESIVGR
jgi:hypothetical protein